MKLHKSIRKYGKFDQNKLDELIELKSYKFVTSYKSQTVNKLFAAILNHSFYEYEKAKLYKHKTNHSYMLYLMAKSIAFKGIQSSYYYFEKLSNLTSLYRKNKPSFINISSESNKKTITLNYRKNGKEHNDHGPAEIAYELSLEDGSFTLIHLEFLKNDCYYNKNGLIYYRALSKNNGIQLKFLKNNILKDITIGTLSTRISINDFNNDTEIIIFDDKHMFAYDFYSNQNQRHRLSGPAIIRKHKETKITTKEWWIHDELLPNDIIGYEKGKEKDITKSDILKAMLFDKEYGEFLQEKFNENKIT